MMYSKINDYEILIDGLYLHIEWNGIELESHTFPNEKMLSASLKDRVSYATAYDFLIEHNVPKDSNLWFLNHSNPWT